jgi:hypothetical protein
MTTADDLIEQALSFASGRTSDEDAVLALLAGSGGRRVAVVRARQALLARMAEHGEDEATTQAVASLDAVLARMPV